MGIVFEVFGFESGKFGTPNPKVLFDALFDGMVFGQIPQPQIHFLFLALDSMVFGTQI